MSIEISAVEVYLLADGLHASADGADDAASRLGARDVGGDLQTAVDAFLDSHRTAGQALAGELRWLGDTVATVAGSWLTLDRTLLAHARREAGR
jgi:hypothetical protein